jgi:hypothetical protein
MTGADDWQGRARREVVAILEGATVHRSVSWDDLVSLMAVAWLQGVSLGSHETLNAAEQAFTRFREER